MKYGPALEKAFGNLEALTSKAFRKKTMGIEDPPDEATPATEDESASDAPESVKDSVGDDGGETFKGEQGDKALDEESLKRIIEALSNGTK